MTPRDGGTAVLTEKLYRCYGDTEAVSALDLEVPTGSIFGFLGPNGAGKTTTIGVLCTLLRPTAGRAVVAGYDVVRRPDDVRRRISVIFQESTLDQDLTAAENLRFQADLFGIPRRRARDSIASMLDLVDLSEHRDIPVRNFSGGMRRRLEIARGLLHTPEVLFLDEPTTGLDPQTRLVIWDHLHRLRREQQITVFLTTHHLEEAENCDQIAIMDRGTIVARGTPTELKAMIDADLVVLRTGHDPAAACAIREKFGLDAETGPDGVHLRVTDGTAFVPRLCSELGVPVHSVTVSPPSLDDVFVHHTGRTIRETDLGPMTMNTLGRR